MKRFTLVIAGLLLAASVSEACPVGASFSYSAGQVLATPVAPIAATPLAVAPAPTVINNVSVVRRGLFGGRFGVGVGVGFGGRVGVGVGFGRGFGFRGRFR